MDMFRATIQNRRSPFFNTAKQYNQKNNTYHGSNNTSYSPLKIKALVEIAKPTVEVNLTKSFKLNPNIQNISDITWEVPPFQYHLILSEKKIWITGILIASVIYTKKNMSVYDYQVKVPLEKTFQIEYTHPPYIAPNEEKKQYEFLNHYTQSNSTTHMEQTIYKQNPPIFETNDLRITTSRNMSIEKKQPVLELNINCKINFQILQYQMISINTQSL